MNNVNCNIIKGINKKGHQYKAIQFTILTEGGLYKTELIFPSALEMSLIEKTLNNLNGIYSNDPDSNQL